jgi:hypothetical protein
MQRIKSPHFQSVGWAVRSIIWYHSEIETRARKFEPEFELMNTVQMVYQAGAWKLRQH